MGKKAWTFAILLGLVASISVPWIVIKIVAKTQSPETHEPTMMENGDNPVESGQDEPTMMENSDNPVESSQDEPTTLRLPMYVQTTVQARLLTMEELALDFPENYDIEQRGDYHRIAKNCTATELATKADCLPLTGWFKKAYLKSDGSITVDFQCNPNDSRMCTVLLRGPVSDGTVYGCGLPDAALEDILVMDLLGAGYSLLKDGAVEYIRYGGKDLTGGHHSFFIKDGLIYGRYGTDEELVRRADGSFVRESGSFAEQIRKEAQAKKVLDFLGSGYSMRYDAVFEFIQYDKQDVVPRGYHYYILRDDRIYGILGATEEEVLANRPKIPPEKRDMIGQSYLCPDLGLGTWVELGYKELVCVHLPERGPICHSNCF